MNADGWGSGERWCIWKLGERWTVFPPDRLFDDRAPLRTYRTGAEALAAFARSGVCKRPFDRSTALTYRPLWRSPASWKKPGPAQC